MPGKKLIIIGISGVTCGGKTTLANALHEQLPGATIISQDDYFLDVNDPRHVWIEELNHINFDVISSLNMDKMLLDIKEHIEKNEGVLIIEGFSIFNNGPIEKLCNLKYYFKLKKEVCRERRIKRIYNPPDCPGYFDICVWPEHLKQIKEVEDVVDGVTYFNNFQNETALEMVLHDIKNISSE